MFEEGFISIDRKIVNWEWYKDANTKALFLHLIFIANWKDGRFKGYDIPRGSVVTSIAHLARDTGLTNQQVKTALKHLKNTGEITSTSTNKFTIVTLVKYGFYQDPTPRSNKQANKQLTNKQQTTNKQLTTIEQYNNNNNNNNKNNSLSLREGENEKREREIFSEEVVAEWAKEFDDPEHKINPAGHVVYVESHGGDKSKVSFDSYCINRLHLQKIKNKEQEEKAVEEKTPEQIRQEKIEKWRKMFG